MVLESYFICLFLFTYTLFKLPLVERNMRRNIFDVNVERVRNGQMAFDLGLRSYDQRINCFGDLSFEEFGTQYLGLGILGGDSADIDTSIVPQTERIIDNIRRNYVHRRQGGSLDWSLRGK